MTELTRKEKSKLMIYLSNDIMKQLNRESVHFLELQTCFSQKEGDRVGSAVLWVGLQSKHAGSGPVRPQVPCMKGNSHEISWFLISCKNAR